MSESSDTLVLTPIQEDAIAAKVVAALNRQSTTGENSPPAPDPVDDELYERQLAIFRKAQHAHLDLQEAMIDSTVKRGQSALTAISMGNSHPRSLNRVSQFFGQLGIGHPMQADPASQFGFGFTPRPRF